MGPHQSGLDNVGPEDLISLFYSLLYFSVAGAFPLYSYSGSEWFCREFSIIILFVLHV